MQDFAGAAPMRAMVIVKATKESEAGALPSAQLMADMGAFNQKLIHSGMFVDAGGLKASSKGRPRRLFGQRPHRDEGAVCECQRTRLWLLDLEGQRSRRGERLGQTLPQSDARTVEDRNPRALRNGGHRLTRWAVDTVDDRVGRAQWASARTPIFDQLL